MSTVTAGGNVPFDMLDADFGYTHANSIIQSASATLIAVQTPNGHFQTVNGTFSYNALGISGGTINWMGDAVNGNLIYSIGGFSMSVQDWGVFILANNATGQLNFLFGGNDLITGSAFNDRLNGFGGNDNIFGGAGSDIAVFTGNRASYTIAKGNGTTTVTDLRGIDGVDTLTDIEFLQFADVTSAANTLPVVSGANYTPSHAATSVALNTLVTISDFDGDAVQQIEIFDNTAGGGRFRRAGVLQPEKQGIVLAAADFASYEFVTDGAATESVSFRAYDGTAWGAWTTFNINPRANALPTITAPNLTPGKSDAFIAGASLFSVSDSDGDAITRYRFYDGTAGNGRFLLNGAQQAELANIEVDATDLANFGFATSPAGASTLWVQPYDGFGWGAWKSFTVAAVANVAPVASVQNLAPAKGTSFIASSALVTVSDPDDAGAVRYQFFDATTGNGRLQLYGNDLAEQQNVTIEAGDFANLRFRTGTSGSDVLWVQAFDGTAWSTWKSFSVAAPTNVAPTVNVQNLTWAKSDAFLAGASLFTVSDPDDATATKYRFFDATQGNGRFQLNGGNQVELANIEINATDLANFRYAIGSTGAGDTLWVQAYDGFDWGAWKSFTVSAPPNNAPVVSPGNLFFARGTTEVKASSLFFVSDADGDSIIRYRFFDGTAGSGHFRKNGVDQPDLINITVDVIDMVTTDYVLGSGSDVVWVQAFDGTSWSAWKSFTVAPPPNYAPVVTVNLAGLTPTKTFQTVAVTSFFSISDADGDTISHFRFFDGTSGNGRFETDTGSPLGEMQNVLVQASDLSHIRYRTSTTGAGDTLWVQAFDGTSWGAWKSFDVSAPANFAPVVNVHDITPARTDILLSDSALYTSTFDADGDAITKFRFFDGTSGNGRFELNGAPAAELQNIELNATDLASLRFRTSRTGSGDTLWIQVYDGSAWSAWKSFSVGGWTNSAPVLTTSPNTVIPSHEFDVFAAAALFTVSDADGDAMTQYRFFDGTTGNGRFELNGVGQVELSNITVNASDLANFRFRPSTTDAGDVLWVQAFDGTAWSAWKTVTVAPVPNELPIVQAQSFTPAHGVTSMFASSLFTMVDTDQDFVGAVRFLDATPGNGYFTLNGVQKAAGAEFEVHSSDLANLRYVTSTTGAGDTLSVQVYDGYDWSDRKTFTVAAPQSSGPTIYVENLVYDLVPNYVAASSMVVAANPGSIQRYRFLDADNGGGGFRLNGVAQQEQHVIEIDAADLPNLIYMGGGKETISVQAFDGVAWTDWQSFEARSITYGQHGSWTVDIIPTLPGAPIATPANAVVQAGSSVGLAQLLSATDPQGDAITEWHIRNNSPGRGTLSLNGVAQTAFEINVMADQLASLEFLAGAPGFSRLWASATDATGAESEWKPFIINTLAPV